MKRLMGFAMVFTVALSLGGCASMGSAQQSGVATASSGRALAMGPAAQDHNPRGGVAAAVDSPRSLDNIDPREGIPTPEPAVPQREIHLAGPTPQIPIPGGRAGIYN